MVHFDTTPKPLSQFKWPPPIAMHTTVEAVEQKPEPKQRKPAKPALSESFWISWGFLQTSIDSVFKKWPSMHAHFDIVKTELEGLK